MEIPCTMFNLNIPPSSLLGVDGSGGLCSKPNTPEILNSLIAMTNPLDNYIYNNIHDSNNNNNNNDNNNNNNNSHFSPSSGTSNTSNTSSRNFNANAQVSEWNVAENRNFTLRKHYTFILIHISCIINFILLKLYWFWTFYNFLVWLIIIVLQYNSQDSSHSTSSSSTSPHLEGVGSAGQCGSSTTPTVQQVSSIIH